MPDSWRNILERAAENLSIDLDQESRLGQQSAGWPTHRRVTPPPFALPYLIERERAARPEDLSVHPLQYDRRPAQQASPRQSETRAARPSKAHTRGPWGEFAPAVISAGIVALTIYAIYNLLH